jgi:shikimate dehydrogenase
MAGYPFTHEYLGFIDALPQSATVFEVIINPPETPVISAARQRGLKTVPGMRMLAGQMDVIFDFMFGVKLTMEHKEACIAELNEYLGLEEK